MGEISVKFGQRVRYYRKELKLSQEQLSELCGLHPTYIGQLERGEKNPSIETVAQLCRGLKITPEKLFENFLIDGSESTAHKAYDLFLNIPPEKQEALLELLKAAARMIE